MNSNSLISLQNESVPETEQDTSGRRNISRSTPGHGCRLDATSHGRQASVIIVFNEMRGRLMMMEEDKCGHTQTHNKDGSRGQSLTALGEL